MTFSLSLEICIFISVTKVNDFFCFLLKTELVWYLESCHLYLCRSRVSTLQLVSVSSLWSDSASISGIRGVMTHELQEILSQTKLRSRRHSRYSVYNWFCWNGKGDIKSHPKKPKLLHPSTIAILGVRLHADNCCLGDAPQYKDTEIRTPWAQCQYFPKRVKLKRHKSADGGYESPLPSILI